MHIRVNGQKHTPLHIRTHTRVYRHTCCVLHCHSGATTLLMAPGSSKSCQAALPPTTTDGTPCAHRAERASALDSLEGNCTSNSGATTGGHHVQAGLKLTHQPWTHEEDRKDPHGHDPHGANQPCNASRTASNPAKANVTRASASVAWARDSGPRELVHAPLATFACAWASMMRH